MKSIRAKLMLLFFSSIVVASIIIGVMSTVLTSGVIEKSSNENMNLLCKTNAKELDVLFAKVEDSVGTLSHYAQEELPNMQILKDESLRAAYTSNLQKSALHHIESTEGAAAVWFHFDASYIGKTDGFFYVKDETTKHFASHPLTVISDYDTEERERVDWWYTPVEKGEAVWLDAYYDTNIKQNIVSYAVPLYKDGQLFGVLGADISISYIEETTKEISAENFHKVAVLQKNGGVVYHPTFESGHLIGEENPAFNQIFETLFEKAPTNQLIEYELNGEDKMITGYKLRNAMLMVCFAPVSEIYASQHYLISISILIIAAVILGMLLIAFFISNALARPIKNLNEAAKGLVEGKFDYAITSSTNDEIGELTSTFIEARNIIQYQFDLLDMEAHRDGLTGVGNKSALMDREVVLDQSIADGTAAFSVAVFDVNRLKITNDVFGHMAGDKLLLTVSSFLVSYFDAPNVYRMGGDEFVVIIPELSKDDCTRLIDKCIADMHTLVVEGVPDCRVSCAYGVAHYQPYHDQQWSDVLRRADKEMYKNKALTKQETFPWQDGLKGIKQLQIEKYCQLLQTLISSTDDYLFLMNTETGVIRFFGDDPSSFEIADGRALSNGISDILSFVYVNDHTLIKNAVSSIISHDTDSIDLDFRMQDNHNHSYWVNCRGSVVEDDSDNRFLVIGRISKNAIKHLYNPVTTLFNKAKLKADLQSEASDRFNYLMLIDIDNLSAINLKHGSAYGDDLLKTLAHELESRFSMQQIYHAEKDRFVVLLNTNSGKEIERVFEELKTVMAPKCSISASVVPNDRSSYINVENAYDYAVEMMDVEKKNGISQLVFFSKENLLEKISAVKLFEELEESVKNQYSGFRLVYQPQINADDFSIHSVEALLRYESKTDGLVYPNRIIPLLEQTGLINDVGIWVVDEALRQCKKWRQYVPDFKISVNMSAAQLKKRRIATQIANLLARYDLPGDALILEITESTQLDKNADTFSTIEKLQQAGIRIAIDDFGTGYSNLGNLKHIHASILKVDRIFIHGTKENNYHYNLIQNIIEFAKSNSLKICLEGVESTDEFVILSGLRPDFFQGYLFDKPCSAEQIEATYFAPDTEECAKRLKQIEQLSKERRHAPIINMETKTILRGINVGLWIIRIHPRTNEGELYTDETMRKLLGIDKTFTPEECYRHWQERISESDRPAVKKMVNEMADSEHVVQAKYLWHHPVKGAVTVRCSGRCVTKDDEMLIFEGFHRIVEDI